MLSLSELVECEGPAGRVGAALVDGDGQPTCPLLVVDLDGDADAALVERAVRVARERERIVVGITARPGDPRRQALAECLDTSYALAPAHGSRLARQFVAAADPLGQATLLHEVASARPRAALALAQVLRATGALAVRSGLELESFAYSTLLGGTEFADWQAGRRPPRPVPDAPAPVVVDRDGPVLRVTLNRPERRNAYGRQLRDHLVAALQIALVDPGVEQVWLDGAGPSFCAGGDLDEFGTTPDATTGHFVRTSGGAGALMARLAARVRVRVHGHCVGAGIELPAFAGQVTARPDTVLRLPEVSMGLIPGAGGTVSIPRRVGRWRAFALALSGAALDVGTAVDWGLVDEVADGD